MSQFKQLYLPLLVSVAMNIGNIHASAAAGNDPREGTDTRAASSPSASSTTTTNGQWSFNFLSKKYPSLKTRAQGPFISDKQHEHTREELTQVRDNKEPYLSMFETQIAQTMSKTIEMMTNSETATQIAIYTKNRPSNVEDYGQFLDLAKSPFANPFRQLKTSKRFSITADIALSGGLIYDHISRGAPGTAIFLGRTSCFPYLSYSAFLQADESGSAHQRGIHLNFSGNPDMETLRATDFYKKNKDLIHARNMVTPEKLEHYLQHMASKKLSRTLGQKIYIVDTVGTGGGLNSFLKILYCYYERQGMSIPDVEFLYLGTKETLAASSGKSFSYNPESAGKGIITFIEDKKKNIYPFTVSTTIIHVDGPTIQQVLDSDYYQALFSFGIEYPAQKWAPAYDEEREQGGPLSQDVKTLFEVQLKSYVSICKTLAKITK